MVVPAVFVLIVAGLQVPVMPFDEVACKFGGVLFSQILPKGANSGIVSALTVIVVVTVLAHCPAAGVKV